MRIEAAHFPNTHPRTWSARDSLVGLVLVTLAGALLAVALPALVAELNRIPAHRYYVNHVADWRQDPVPPAPLARGISLLEGALPSAGATELRYLAYLLLRHAQQPSDAAATAVADAASTPAAAAAAARPTAPRSAAVVAPAPDPIVPVATGERIGRIVGASLSREPAHPLGWAYLADAELRFGGSGKRAVALLNQSYRVAPIEPDSLFFRLQIALRASADWDIGLLHHLGRDLRAVYNADPWHPQRPALTRLVKAQPALRNFLERLLREDPQALQQYQDAFQRYR